MNDESKTKKQLICELMACRQRIKNLEAKKATAKSGNGHSDRLSNREIPVERDPYILIENQEILEYLKKSRLFSHLPDRIIEQLLPLSHLEEYPAGTEILKEGAANTEAFFLIKGTVGVYAGGSKISELRRKGDIFGEMSIISNRPCSASVIAETPVRVFSIHAKHIGRYTDIETNELDNIFYRIFAMILTEKLSRTNKKAQQYEVTHNDLIREIDERKLVEKELQKAKNTLEKRVEERTSELKASNVRLQREIEERMQAEEKRFLLEKQLRQSQKMQALGTLTGGIAHEFNNILQIIVGYTDLTRQNASEENFRENLHEVIKAGNRGKELVEQLLNFTHPQENKFKPLRIAPIVKESVKMMRSTLSPSIEIKDNIDSSCGAVSGDGSQLHQVLVNLFNNASHALKNGKGIIEIGLDQIELDSDSKTITTLTAGKYVRLSIRDNGCGMSPEIRERVFEPFFTTKDIGQGTGLGLSVVYGIIRSHKGTVNVKSTLGKGSAFEIYFPLVDAGSSELPADAQKVFRKGEEHILFVDDEPAIVNLYKRFLVSRGYTVTTSTSSIRAFEIFCESPHDFDMVITDKGMPEMDGLQLTQNLLKVRPDLPVILLTGYGDLIHDNQVREAGFSRIFTKPLDFSEMSQALRLIFDGIA